MQVEPKLCLRKRVGAIEHRDILKL